MKLILSATRSFGQFVDILCSNLFYQRIKTKQVGVLFILVITLLSTNLLSANIGIHHVIQPNNGNCNGLIILDIEGDAGPFDVEVYMGPTLVTSVLDAKGRLSLSELCAGNYLILVTDDFGCVKELSQAMNNCSTMNFDEQCGDRLYPSCESNNGAIRVLEECFTGVVPPLTYKWQSGETSNQIFGLTAGTYVLTVTDVNSCTGVFFIELLSESDPNASVLDIEGCNAPIITTNGVSGPFNFLWSDGYECNAVYECKNNDLQAGNYSVTVFHVNEDIDSECAEIFEFNYSSNPNDIINLQVNNLIPTCNGENTGSLDYSFENGVPPFKITFGSKTINTNERSGTLENLSAGSFRLYVISECGSGRYTLEEYSIENEILPELEIISFSQIICSEEGGFIEFTEVNNIHYSWKLFKNPNIDNPIQVGSGKYTLIKNLLPGSYYLQVRDDQWDYCFSEFEFEITDEEPGNFSDPTILLSEINANTSKHWFALNCDNKSIEPKVVGGNPPYRYIWKSEGNIIFDDYVTDKLSNAAFGIYEFSVVDKCGNKVSKEINFECQCSADFWLYITDPCNDLFYNTRARLKRIPSDAYIYNLKWRWESGGDVEFQNEFYQSGWINGSDGEFNMPDGDNGDIYIMVENELGCVYEMGMEVRPSEDNNGPLCKIPTAYNGPRLPNLLRALIPSYPFNSASEENTLVYAYGAMEKYCGTSYIKTIDRKRLSFIPDPYPLNGNPCNAGGVMKAEINNNCATKFIQKNIWGIELTWNDGKSDRCACLFPEGSINNNIYPVLAEIQKNNTPSDDPPPNTGTEYTWDFGEFVRCDGNTPFFEWDEECYKFKVCIDDNDERHVLEEWASPETTKAIAYYHVNGGCELYVIDYCEGSSHCIDVYSLATEEEEFTLPIYECDERCFALTSEIVNSEYLVNNQNIEDLESMTKNSRMQVLEKFDDVFTKKVNKGNFLIFPNPTNNTANINVEPECDDCKYLVQIYTHLGVFVKEIKLNQSNNYSIKDFSSDFSSGIYFVIILLDETRIATSKFVKLN